MQREISSMKRSKAVEERAAKQLDLALFQDRSYEGAEPDPDRSLLVLFEPGTCHRDRIQGRASPSLAVPH